MNAPEKMAYDPDRPLAPGAESLRQFYQALWARGPAGVKVSLRVLHGPNVRDVTVTSIDRSDFMTKRPTV